MRVYRAPEANAVALAARVRERAAELGRRTAAGLRVQVVVDRSQEVVAALRELGIAALIGLILGVAVLRLLLGRWRPTLALAVAVPSSMLATFSAFHLCGVPLDVVSLAGLAATRLLPAAHMAHGKPPIEHTFLHHAGGIP